MATLVPSIIAVFDDYAAAVRKCRREIIAQSWFEKDWWINLAFDTNGFTFQLAKTGWHNHDSRGVHFEFWIGEQEANTKELPIVLHFEPDVPDRATLGTRFREAFEPHAEDFADYRVNHTAICDKLTKQIKFSKSSLAKTVVPEFSRLQALGPTIDRILAS